MNETDIKRSLRILKKAFVMFCSFISDYDCRNQGCFRNNLNKNFDISTKALFLQMLIFQLAHKFKLIDMSQNKNKRKSNSIYQFWVDFTKILKKNNTKICRFPQNFLTVFTTQKKFLNNSQFKQLNDFFSEAISASNSKNSTDAAYLIAYAFESILDISIADDKNLSIKNSTHCKKNGVFYTPLAIVKYTVELAFKDFLQQIENLSAQRQVQQIHELKICDPAVGSGLFLIEALNFLKNIKLNSAGEKSDASRINATQIIENSLYGVDINPLSVEITKINMAFISQTQELDMQLVNQHVKCGDSIVGADVDLILKKQIKRNINEKLCKVAGFARETASFKKIKRIGSKKQLEIFNFWCLLWFYRFKDEADYQACASTFLDKIRNLQKPIDENNQAEENNVNEMLSEIMTEHPFFHWQIEFPDVFKNSKDTGFDIIVGNPPYRSYYSRHSGKNDDDSENFENFVSIVHSSIDGAKALTDRINFFLLFIIQGTKLLRKKGSIAFVLPDSIAINEGYKTIRTALTKKKYIRDVSVFENMVFPLATVGTAILCWQRCLPQKPEPTLPFDQDNKKSKLNNINQVNLNTVETDENGEITNIQNNPSTHFRLLRRPFCNWLPGFDEIKLDENNLCYLDDIAFVKDGINPGKAVMRQKLVLKPENAENLARHAKKVIEGQNIDPFRITWGGKYILYDPEMISTQNKLEGTSLRKEWIFTSPKIVYRQTASRIIASIDFDQHFSLNSVHNIVLKNHDDVVLFALAGYLNSDFFTNLYQKFSGETRKVYPQVHVSIMKKLPVPKIILENTKEMEKLAEMSREISNYSTKSSEYRKAFIEINSFVKKICP